MRFRIEQLLSSDDEIRGFYELTDFESGLNTDTKIKMISNIIANKLIPFFKQHNSVVDILKSDQVKPHMYWNNGKYIATKLCV